MSRDATGGAREPGATPDDAAPPSLSSVLSPFSYRRRNEADHGVDEAAADELAAAELTAAELAAAGPTVRRHRQEVTVAADDAVSEARIEPETGQFVLPKLVWPENEPWRAPLPVIEPDFLREVDAAVARDAQRTAAAANGHAEPPAAGPAAALFEPPSRAPFEPPVPVGRSRPAPPEPQPVPPPILTPRPADDPHAPPGPPVFPWQIVERPPVEEAFVPTTPLIERAPRADPPPPAPGGNGLPTLGSPSRPGPDFEPIGLAGLEAIPQSIPQSIQPGPNPSRLLQGEFDDAEQPGDDPSPRPRTLRRLGIGAAIGLGLLVLYGGVAFALSTRIPPNTTIAGVPVGGMSHTAAADTLRGSLSSLKGPVRVSVAGTEDDIDPVQAGLTFNPDKTIKTAFGFTVDPVVLWHRIVGGLRISPNSGTDRSRLSAVITDLAARTRLDPKDAGVDFAGGGATLREPVTGRSLDVLAATDLVDRSWLGTNGTVVLPVTEQQPTTDRQEAAAALERIAKPALAGPLLVAVGSQRVSLSPEQFGPTLSMKANEVGELSLALDGAALRTVLLAAEPTVEHKPADARIILQNGAPKVVPAVDGITVEPGALAAAALQALNGTDRTATLNPAPLAAALSTAKAQALGIKEQTSSWSTPVTSDPLRTTNLRVATKALNGLIVQPGQVFSLNAALGERTEEKGYQQAIVISEGQYEKGIGGGVSNVATLVFNNVFFSGLDDITHKPHSFYISRYPVGREATVHWPDVDLKWRNDSPYGVLIQAWVDSKVHVAFWSTKSWEIQAITGQRTNTRAPKTVYSTKSTCVQQPASPGFDINVTRVFSRAGKEVRREVFTTNYIAEDKVICGSRPTSSSTTTATTAPGGLAGSG